MKTDSVNNKLRLTEALKSQSTQQPKTQPELAKTSDRIGDRSNDAVRSSVDSRLLESPRSTGSGRSIDEIRNLVQSGEYLDSTPVEAVAGAVARDLL
ncbi:MAG: hypothetical protein KDD60_11495 [Bdellovibrionales bacterium]|nr:hypothetical protein [Bdellovibrionales bacterium]